MQLESLDKRIELGGPVRGGHWRTEDDGEEVAYETAVLGRLRRGYRVLLLRSSLGTRIELCYLFVHVYFGQVINLWPTPRQVRGVAPLLWNLTPHDHLLCPCLHTAQFEA